MKLHGLPLDILLYIFQKLYRNDIEAGVCACINWSSTCHDARQLFLRSEQGRQHYHECYSSRLTNIEPGNHVRSTTDFPFSLQVKRERRSCLIAKTLYKFLGTIGTRKFPTSDKGVYISAIMQSARLAATCSETDFLFLYYIARRHGSFPRPRGGFSKTHRAILVRLNGNNRIEAPDFDWLQNPVEQLVASPFGDACAIVYTPQDYYEGALLLYWTVKCNTVTRIIDLSSNGEPHVPCHVWFAADLLFVHWSNYDVVGYKTRPPFECIVRIPAIKICCGRPMVFHASNLTIVASCCNGRVAVTRINSEEKSYLKGSRSYTLPFNPAYYDAQVTPPLAIAVSPNEQHVCVLASRTTKPALCVFFYRFNPGVQNFTYVHERDTLEFPTGDADNGEKLRDESVFDLTWSPCSSMLIVIRHHFMPVSSNAQYLYIICISNGVIRRAKHLKRSVPLHQIEWQRSGLLCLTVGCGTLFLR